MRRIALPISQEPIGTTQPFDVCGLSATQRDLLVISAQEVDGRWVILSRYGEDRWKILGLPTNIRDSEGFLDFTLVPAPYRDTMKAILYRYVRRGRAGKKRPTARSIVKLLSDAGPFLQHLHRLSIGRLSEATPMVCAVYAQACKEHRQRAPFRGAGKPLKASSLMHRFGVVEAIYELSQHTEDPMTAHPWLGTSATHMAGMTGPGTSYRGGKTPLIPDEVFTTLFRAAWAAVARGTVLLNLRDGVDRFKKAKEDRGRQASFDSLTRYLKRQGWLDGLGAFNIALRELRTACYIVIASVSGCRNHELGLIQSDACYSTEEPAGAAAEQGDALTYWWMRSESRKTDEGRTEWMIPEAGVTALRIMDRWAKPYQAEIEVEIAWRRAADPLDPEIAEAQRHLKAVFLSVIPSHHNVVRTASSRSWNMSLKVFAKNAGVNWPLATHQFRRKFANYAARSQFGDLRYLKEHFKHWSMDMTLGYALNDSQEMTLYVEIQDELDDIKAGLADSWLRPHEPLAGGYGTNIMAWRGGEAVTIFKSHQQMVRALANSTAIRSNGHAWCTADDNRCIGNDIERTRCIDCSNAVIGHQHARLYQGLYDHLKEVLVCDDIGEGGLNMVRRDMARCRDVLVALGHDDQELPA